MFEFVTSGPMVPFSISLFLLIGLMALELVFLALGGTLLSSSDADLDLDVDAAPELGEISIPELDALDAEIDLGEYELAAVEAEVDVFENAGAPASGGFLGWLGFGKVPFLIWFSAALLGYGLSGMTVQVALQSLAGFALPATVAGILMLPVGLGFAKGFGQSFARALPRAETTALSTRNLGRRKGVVSQGTARRGAPAEVRIIDGFGNMHYLRAEPLEDTEEISQGSDVLVLRHRPSGGYRLVRLS